MSYFIDICFICLKHTNNLITIGFQDANGLSFKNKLKDFVPGLTFESNIPKYICASCGRNLNRICAFKQIFLQNKTTYEKYAQKITAKNGRYEYLSVIIRPHFVCVKEELSYENILEPECEINEDVMNNEEFIIKEETNEEIILSNKLEIKEENLQSVNTDSCKLTDNIVEENELLSNVEKFKSKKCDKKISNLEKSYKCETCNKSFGLLSTLEEHKLSHTSEKPFTCEVCNKSFGRLTILKRHQIVHTGEKPFTCEVCNKSFGQSSTLKKHKLQHSGEKPFTCEICKKSFREAGTLKHHNLIHTGEKPYTCEFCKKTFRQLQHLKHHRSIHSNEKLISCEICQKSFSQLRYLKQHLSTHSKNSTA